MDQQKKAFENMGKGENASNQHFSFFFFHSVFLPIKNRNHHLNNIPFVVCKCCHCDQGQNFVVMLKS